MSAYMCDDKHLRLLAAWCMTGRGPMNLYVSRVGEELKRETATRIAKMLAQENWESVSYRYQRESIYNPSEALTVTDSDINEARCKSPVEIIKSAQCLEYQSCEHPGWNESNAKKQIASIIDRAITWLSGYEDANWGAPGTSTNTQWGSK